MGVLGLAILGLGAREWRADRRSARRALVLASKQVEAYGLMFGGIAVWRNLLCVAYSEARSEVWLIDLDESRVLSHWQFGGGETGFASAGGVAFGPHGEIFIADTANHSPDSWRTLVAPNLLL